MTDLAFIDTSGEQHPNGAAIDWVAVRASGVDGVYVKLSEGGVLDPHGQQDVRDAAAAGLHVGVYHFARPDLNQGTAGAQAEAAAFNGFRAGLPTDCPPVLDTEREPITQEWNDAFDAAVPGDLGYTYRAALGTLADIPDSRIWAAVPDATSRTVPIDGFMRTFGGVQYGTATIPGIQTPADVDWFDPAFIGDSGMSSQEYDECMAAISANKQASDNRFVELMYEKYLGRTAEGAAFGYWDNVMDSETWPAFSEQLSATPEAQNYRATGVADTPDHLSGPCAVVWVPSLVDANRTQQTYQRAGHDGSVAIGAEYRGAGIPPIA